MDESEEGKGGKAHGVVRGSSLPYDRPNSKAVEESSSNSARNRNEGEQFERNVDKSDAIRPTRSSVAEQKVEESDAVRPSAEVSSNAAGFVGKQIGAECTGDQKTEPSAALVVDERVKTALGTAVGDSTPATTEHAKDDDDETTTSQMNDAEYRLTMIQSVREAVNRICEQAVEKTAAIVKSGHGDRHAATPSSSVRDKRDADDSEAADYASSEFSLPPLPLLPPSDQVSPEHFQTQKRTRRSRK